MPLGYAQTFNLKDLFCDDELKGVLPYIKLETGKDDDVLQAVFDISKPIAEMYLKPLNGQASGNTVLFTGNQVGNLYECAFHLSKVIRMNKDIFTFSANNGDIIRDIIKRNGRESQTKLYLRAISKMQIQSMIEEDVSELLEDVQDNLYYNPEFAFSQQKFAVKKLQPNAIFGYNARRLAWERRVGII